MPRLLFLLLLVITVAGCANLPWWSSAKDDGPAPRPAERIDAFEDVDASPRRGSIGSAEGNENLSTDIERLQDARRKYDAAQDQRAAENRRRQAECRASGKGREVVIEDGSAEPATYCELPQPE